MNIDFFRRLRNTESKILCCAEMELTRGRMGTSKYGFGKSIDSQGVATGPLQSGFSREPMGIRQVTQRIQGMRKRMLQGTEGIRPGY